MSETPPSAPQQPEPASGPKMDWRIIAIAGVAVLFIAAIFINRSTNRDRAARQTTTTTEPAASGPALTPEQQYEMILQMREAEAVTFRLALKDEQYIVARMGGAIAEKKGDQIVRHLDIGGLFNVTRLAKGVEARMIHRRVMFAQEAVPAFKDYFPPLGLQAEPAMVFTAADKVTMDMLDEREGVVGVEIGGEVRAYPTRMLNFHDVINDTVGGKEIAVTWNFLAGGAIVLDRSVGGGAARRFGNAGLIYQSGIVMYDADTLSLWSPLTGRCIAGELAGVSLQQMPCALTTWAAWRRLHPQGQLLTGTNPTLSIEYSRSFAAPPGYMAGNPSIPYPVYGLDVTKTPMSLKTQVMGVVLPEGKGAKAYSVGMLKELATQPAPGAVDTDGAAVRVPEMVKLEDTISGEKVTLTFDRSSELCTATTAEGRTLVVNRLIWMAWYAAHPDTALWKEEEVRARMKQVSEDPPAPPMDPRAPAR